ncbi:M28 family metallopeptidase [Sphingomonas sp.]|uniref:M28 family metallopeptidase n=1 Tax=Sphingomonas sp. TaxID=28214 RepID=UPI0025F010FC|nr:M28 family metallopeptidase [Sphingomonas sp.]MBV9527448.1 M28 family peptidase [Sphingomonas sp.]
MNRLRWISASVLALVGSAAVAAPTGQFSPERLSDIDKALASDGFQGRGTAAAIEPTVIDYIAKQFAAAGVQPGGDMVNGQRSWFQAVPLLQSEIVGTPQISLNENGTVVPLRQGPDIAILAPLNGAKQVTIANAPLVFVGYGVTAPERNWDDFKGVDVHGKVIVVLINDPDFEGGEGDFGGKAMTYYGRWTYKYEEAARHGAAGVIIVHETAPASYPWNVVQNSNTNAQFDIVRQDPAAAHSGMESWIQRPLAVDLFRRSGLDFEQAKAAARRRDFHPIPLKATLSASYAANPQVITSHNVVGLLPGSSHPDETLIYSAHWDHLGVGKPDATGDTIYNGAVDNATGVAQLVEQARAFAHGPRPQRSIVFLAVTGEEKGLLGSNYYATHPLYPLGKTVGVLNTDALNVWGPTRNFSISGSARLDLLDDLIAEGKREGRAFAADPHPEAGHFYRSDHFSFAKVGVPAVSFESGNDMVNGGTARGEALSADYTAHHYHQPSDEWSPQWDFSGLARDGEMLHAVGERLANSREWPNWSPDSEFRATRDQSASDRTGTAPAPMPVSTGKGERG